MRIVYISSPSFADCDYPLIRSMRKNGINVKYWIPVNPWNCHSTLIDIRNPILGYKLIKASKYEAFRKYNVYLDSDSVCLINAFGNGTRKFGVQEVVRTALLWFRLFIKVLIFNPDIIHITQFFPKYTWYWYHVFRRRLVVTIHDPLPHRGEYDSHQEVLREKGLDNVAGVILLNDDPEQKTVFERCYCIDSSRIFHSSLSIYDCLRVINIDKSIQYHSDFLFLGRISPYKGLEFLLEAMTIVHEVYPKAKLIVAGGGEWYFDRSQYQYLSYIDFKDGFIVPEEMASLYNGTRCVVCPYIEATQSGVALSAFAFDKPVIATRTGVFPKLINDGVNGYLTTPSDANSLTEAMIRFLNSPLQMQKDTIKYVKNWEEIVDEYRSVYHSILQ